MWKQINSMCKRKNRETIVHVVDKHGRRVSTTKGRLQVFQEHYRNMCDEQAINFEEIDDEFRVKIEVEAFWKQSQNIEGFSELNQELTISEIFEAIATLKNNKMVSPNASILNGLIKYGGLPTIEMIDTLLKFSMA